MSHETGAIRDVLSVQGAMLDALPAHVSLLDHDGRIVAVNKAWRRFARESRLAAPASGIGLSYLDVCDRCEGPTAHEAHAVAAGTRAVLNGTRAAFSVEYTCHAPGRQRWFRLTVMPVEGGTGAVSMHVDVTAERMATQALRDQEALLKSALRIAQMGSWVFDLRQQQLWWAAQTHELFGVTLEQLGGSLAVFEALLFEEDRALRDAAYTRASTVPHDAVEVEYRVRRPDGSVRWMLERGSIECNDEGTPIRRLGVVMDITNRKRAEEERRELLASEQASRKQDAQNQASLRIAGRVAKLGGWVYSVQESRLAWSGETAAIHDEPGGFSPSLSGAINYYVPEDRERVRRAVTDCCADGTSFDTEMEIVTARGRRAWVRVIGEALRDEDGLITHVQGACQDISDQKAAQEQIRILAGRLLDTFESISDSFFTVDRDWKFVYLNSAAERLLGRDRGEMIGRSIWDVFEGARDSLYFREAHRAVAEGVALHFESLSTELGRWIEADAHPSREGLAVYFRDVTERRKSREVVRESEERFRLLSKATNDAIWDWNLVTDALWWNEGFTTLFGFSPAERKPTRESWSDQLHPDERDEILSSVQAAILGGESAWSRQYRFRRRDGAYAFVLDRGHIIRDDAGKGVRMIGGMTDLSERKRVEERLEEQATLLDKANDAILTRDLEHRVLYWNRSAERLYGWSAAEALGRSVADLLHPATDAFRAATEATLAKGEWVGELDQSTKDGRTLTVECHWTLVRDAGGEPKSILSIDSDITQRKKLEVQYLRVQRMESIGALASGIAHDLNNTLAPLLVTASMLRETATDPRLREDLITIETCAQRGADMVRQLLSFARGADDRREKVDLRTIVATTQKLVRDTFPKNIVFRSVVAPDLWSVNANPTQMHQVLTNLCVNARDAMPLGGTLTIEVECVVIDESYAAMNLEAKPGPHVLMRVQDTGTGIPEEILDRIFDPFFTTKEVGKGTGLGLSTMHAIVRNHGGMVHVYSEVGTGTQFKVYLPAVASTGSLEKVDLQKPQLPRGHGELVLVVDDEEMIRRVTRRTLERYGYRVMLASDGAEAIALYELHHDEIAVVLTDMSMPVMDGPKTIAALTKLDAAVRIICSSGLNADSYVPPGGSAYCFVPKPYTAEAMLTALRTVLADPA